MNTVFAIKRPAYREFDGTKSIQTAATNQNKLEGIMKFTEEHEWLRPEGDVITVGITEHAAVQLGDLVFVELPEPGTKVKKDDEVAVIESVKAASDILAPLDGEIIEINEDLVETPGLANEDAMGKGWFFKMKPADPAQMDAYMDEAAYKEMIG